MNWTRTLATGLVIGTIGLAAEHGWSATGAQAQDQQTTQAVERAGRALQSLQAALMTRLRQAMEQGGPRQAVGICRDEAQTITRKIKSEQGMAVGRTSHRLRNPANAAPEWAKALVEAAAGRKAAAVEPQVVDLGDRIGVLRPIGLADMCLRCHGPAEAVKRDIGDLLDAAYPADQAVGFAVGDLRGWGWAEVPKK